MWAVGCDVLNELGGAGDGLPMYAGFVGDDGAGVEVREGGESSLEEVHGGRIVVVVEHRGADVAAYILFY